ncbi:MAG: threonylcarbamoyl-AMP synthase [Candidatus Omnitrophica bacterium]|nr:threonylcarbamoyl-AMP synthase [Candidatus Omnitrophota bacterium]
MLDTKVLKVDPINPEEDVIRFAATLLRDGGLVAFPTETVYGIGANFLNNKAMDRLYDIKKRPRNKPFTMHIASIDSIKEMGCRMTPFVEELIKNFWPGPLTLIIKITDPGVFNESKQPVVFSKTGKIGFRMPKNNIAKTLISESGVPLAVPSANISGEKPPVEAGEILDKLGDMIDLVLDGGKTEFGMESTVLEVTKPSYKVLRKGAISEEEIADIWKRM